MTKIIGITGGIGSGKSLVSRALECMGYQVYNADKRSKWILLNDQKVLEAIKSRWSERVLVNNQIIPSKIGAIVFKDEQELKWLNSLLHPRVAHDFKQWIANHQNEKLLFKEAAILFESGGAKELDFIINVNADESIRVGRVIQRDQTTAQEVKLRMSKQMTDQERSALSDFNITNDGKELVLPQLDAILEQLGD